MHVHPLNPARFKVRTDLQARAKPGTMGFSTPSDGRHTLPLTSCALRLVKYCRGISYIRNRSSAPVRSTPESVRPVTPRGSSSDPRPRSCPEPRDPCDDISYEDRPPVLRKPNWLSAITTTSPPITYHHHHNHNHQKQWLPSSVPPPSSSRLRPSSPLLPPAFVSPLSTPPPARACSPLLLVRNRIHSLSTWS